ncbi:MAG TPA: NAD-dependent malic enzyme [Lentisphaeria bacterium]|nr:MAG: hypothetical protein A2X47_10530 [Lentisphaerae bacterium GWF2_38_69]HBM15018.1 NAD-dependent malic enzyme [Lentisphaeria bacterium]
MSKLVEEIIDSNGKAEALKTSLLGEDLLLNPKLNKGTAFTREERIQFGLIGRLPNKVESIEEQASRVFEVYSGIADNLEKSTFLYSLNEVNSTLFYKVAQDHIEEIMPIVYTPVVGRSVQEFNRLWNQNRAVYIASEDIDMVDDILAQYSDGDYEIAIVTDGERILGIGDQGVGGVNISVGKLMVYTLCGGLNPSKALPVVLDVGTNSEILLKDPLYLGARHPRLKGAEYDSFIKKFVDSFKKNLPKTLLHWEDFSGDNARKNLSLYRDELCSFNDDIQGTASISLACVLSGIGFSGLDFKKHRVVVFGAGAAGTGIVYQLCDAFKRFGMSEDEAFKMFYLVDRFGLLVDGMDSVQPYQKAFARNRKELDAWHVADKNNISLLDTVRHAKPTIIIGCSTVAGAFTEEIIREMCKHCSMPIIMPLSNPDTKAEAKPNDLISWTEGKALIATGTPFKAVDYKGRKYVPSQCNNAFIFPGIGLGAVISKASKITDNMFFAASIAVRDYAENCESCKENNQLLPPISEVREINWKVTIAVIKQAIADGVAGIDSNTDIEKKIAQVIWEPKYIPYRKA